MGCRCAGVQPKEWRVRKAGGNPIEKEWRAYWLHPRGLRQADRKAKGQRFNKGKGDIRYSLREDDENVKASYSIMQAVFRQTKGHRLNAVEAEKLASGILHEFNVSGMDVSDVAGRLARAYPLR